MDQERRPAPGRECQDLSCAIANSATWTAETKVEPPLPFKTEQQGDTFFLAFTQRLGPGDQITASFPGTPPFPSAWVMSEVGLASPVFEPPQTAESKRTEPPGDI